MKRRSRNAGRGQAPRPSGRSDREYQPQAGGGGGVGVIPTESILGSDRPSGRRPVTPPVVAPAGELDMLIASGLRRELAQAAVGADHVVLDLSRVTFMDSSAIGAIVAVHKELAARGGGVRLVNPQPPVQRILHITGLDCTLGGYDTLDAARHPAPS